MEPLGLIDLAKTREHHTIYRFVGQETFVHVCFDCDFVEERRLVDLERIQYRPGAPNILHTGSGSTSANLPAVKTMRADLSKMPAFVVAPAPARKLPDSPHKT